METSILRPALVCCVPVKRIGPSGAAYWHRGSCPRFPGQKCITPRPRDTALLDRAHRMESLRTGLVLPFRSKRPYLPSAVAHQVCKTADSDGSTPCSRCAPILHPVGCQCDPCLYDRAHSDDRDDNGIWWAN